MTKNISKQLLVFSATIALVSGCMSQNTLSNPSTQTGAAVGAVTGAVIGGNVGDGSGSNVAAGTALGAITGSVIGNMAHTEQPKQTGGWQ